MSAEMVAQTGASVTLVGHSECRIAQNDTNMDVAKRAELAIKNNLLPIICVGETAAERDAGKTDEIIKQGVRESVPQNAENGGRIKPGLSGWVVEKCHGESLHILAHLLTDNLKTNHPRGHGDIQ